MSRKRKLDKSAKTSKNKQDKVATNWLWLGGFGLIIVIAAGIFFMNRESQPTGPSLPKEISVTEAHQKYENGTYLLDVRTPEEWVDYHIPGTTLIPLDELGSRVDELPKNQEIVVVCRSGNRSQAGRDILLSAGVSQVTSMAGGLIDWNNAGYPVVSGP